MTITGTTPANTVAIQGDLASFHDIAAGRLFGDKPGRVCCDTFGEVFASINDGRAGFGLAAIENSLYGSINEVYDLLTRHQLQIVGEVYLQIEQCLIGLAGAKVSEIKQVFSHPVALAQCADFLDTKLPEAEREEFHDTAASVGHIKRLGHPGVAAIAGRQAAKLHGLEILAPSIETNKANFTRFVALSKPGNLPEGANKTSLSVELNHAPGALYQALGAFASRQINLTKIESRPIVGKAWHYVFYIDVEAGINDKRLGEALNQLDESGCATTVLGSYVMGVRAEI